jgi:TRAP-type C4-dicarboxylate transport system substrate-binding protein
MWVLPGDPIAPEFISVVGATPVARPLGEVDDGLNAGQIDTVVASASAVMALQWHTRLTHVMSQGDAVLVGGTLMNKARFDALPADLRQILTTTGTEAHAALQRRVRQGDDRFYEQLTTRHGMTAVDGSAAASGWRQAATQARERLVGRVYSRDLLDRAIAAGR